MDAIEEHVSDWWALYDLALTANCCIVMMSRRMDRLYFAPVGNNEAPVTPLSVNAARNTLELALLSLKKYSTSAMASYLFSAFQCYVPYNYFAKHLLTSNPKNLSCGSSDMALLDQIAERISSIARQDQDLLPLSEAFQELNSIVHSHWVQ